MVSFGRNREFSKAFEQDYMADPRNCPAPGHQSLLKDAEPEIIDLPMFFRQVLFRLSHPACIVCHHFTLAKGVSTAQDTSLFNYLTNDTKGPSLRGLYKN